MYRPSSQSLHNKQCVRSLERLCSLYGYSYLLWMVEISVKEFTHQTLTVSHEGGRWWSLLFLTPTCKVLSACVFHRYSREWQSRPKENDFFSFQILKEKKIGKQCVRILSKQKRKFKCKHKVTEGKHTDVEVIAKPGKVHWQVKSFN